MTAAQRWADALAAWAIPDEILAAAPESPWGFPERVFVGAAEDALSAPLTVTHRRALEVLPEAGVVLDVGAGAGAASLPLAPPAARIVAVDTSTAMLRELRRLAGDRVRVETIEGRWPDVAAEVEPVDVVVCAHVAYNVADLDAFVVALTDHARLRVVVELTDEHPQAPLSPLWEHFWHQPRPTTPTVHDAIAVIEEALGVRVAAESWRRPHPLTGRTAADTVALARRRLCLPATADAEIEALLGPDPRLTPSSVTTLWWAS